VTTAPPDSREDTASGHQPDENTPSPSLDIVLVPGLWMDASLWDAVLPRLEAAGHRPRPLTLPGMAAGDDRTEVGLAEQVGAVVDVIDTCDGPVVVVGHSAGCGIAHAAVDARPDRVARAVHVAGFPTGDGRSIAPWFQPVAGEVPMPDLADLDETDLRGLDEQQQQQLRARAIPVPGRVVTDTQELYDERRYDVPVTAVATEYTAAALRGWVEAGEGQVSELARMHDVTYVDLPTGHWPQLTRPDDLAEVILAAIGDRWADGRGEPALSARGHDVGTP
jgi:pimeloyl-ACP methyl ester carboxylesterase